MTYDVYIYVCTHMDARTTLQARTMHTSACRDAVLRALILSDGKPAHLGLRRKTSHFPEIQAMPPSLECCEFRHTHGYPHGEVQNSEGRWPGTGIMLALHPSPPRSRAGNNPLAKQQSIRFRVLQSLGWLGAFRNQGVKSPKARG